jgi:cytochrome c5
MNRIPLSLLGVSCAAALAVLGGCDRQPARPSAEQLSTLQPSEPRLAGLYDQSCKACHAKPDSGAPLVHDHDAWDPRWTKGLPALVNHAILGFQAMPAGGQCATCSKDDYANLIRFMADHEAKP